jgi:hypothetical protein
MRSRLATLAALAVAAALVLACVGFAWLRAQ